MGVKTALAGITLTNTDINTAEAAGIDAKGLLEIAELKCAEASAILTTLVNGVLTPASDSGNVSTVNTQITALS